MQVRQDPAQIGELAIDCALSRISGERSKPVERITTASLIVRGSTAAPRPAPVRR